MAKRRKKAKKKSSTARGKCKVVVNCGNRRRLCFGKNGRIVSNRAA